MARAKAAQVCGADYGGERRSVVQTQTGLCQYSNQSPFASRNFAGKMFGEARDRGGIFGDTD
jgi:hypothetical protein